MTHTIKNISPMVWEIELDFTDETIGNVELKRTRMVAGTEEQALLYVPRFANDVRMNDSMFFALPIYENSEVQE